MRVLGEADVVETYKLRVWARWTEYKQASLRLSADVIRL